MQNCGRGNGKLWNLNAQTSMPQNFENGKWCWSRLGVCAQCYWTVAKPMFSIYRRDFLHLLSLERGRGWTSWSATSNANLGSHLQAQIVSINPKLTRSAEKNILTLLQACRQYYFLHGAYFDSQIMIESNHHNDVLPEDSLKDLWLFLPSIPSGW